MRHHWVRRITGLRADGVVEDNELRSTLCDFPQPRKRIVLAIERIERVEHVDDVVGASDCARHVEHVANVKAYVGISGSRIFDRLGVAIDSLDAPPSIPEQVVAAAAAPASDIEQPLPGIFRDRAEGALDRLLLARMRIVTVAN